MNINEVDKTNVERRVSHELGAKRLARQATEAKRIQAEEQEALCVATAAAFAEQTAARAELDDNIIAPMVTEFDTLIAQGEEWNTQMADALKRLRAVIGLQPVLLEGLHAICLSSGKRFRDAPALYDKEQINLLARSNLERQLGRFDFTGGLPPALFDFLGLSVASDGVYHGARAAFLEGLRGKPGTALIPSNVDMNPPAPAPQPAQAPTPARVTPARTALPIETWLSERTRVGVGSTSLEDCFLDYESCCAALNVGSITVKDFERELTDLGVEKKATAKGMFYFLRLR